MIDAVAEFTLGKIGRHHQAAAECRPAFGIHMGNELRRRQRRLAHGQGPAIVRKAPGRLFKAHWNIAIVGWIERVDGVETLGIMARVEPDQPAAVIVHRCCRPGPEAHGLETAHARKIHHYHFPTFGRDVARRPSITRCHFATSRQSGIPDCLRSLDRSLSCGNRR
ncbi:hypothetical protein D9M70_505600 [compost metagenome]